jgi:hypothetical protein
MIHPVNELNKEGFCFLEINTRTKENKNFAKNYVKNLNKFFKQLKRKGHIGNKMFIMHNITISYFFNNMND